MTKRMRTSGGRERKGDGEERKEKRRRREGGEGRRGKGLEQVL